MTRTIFTANLIPGLAHVGMAVIFTLVMASCTLTEEDHAPQAQISIASTDFRSPASVEALRNRVRRVAREMCVSEAASGRIAMLPSQRACYDKAISTGFAEIARSQQLATGETASVRSVPSQH